MREQPRWFLEAVNTPCDHGYVEVQGTRIHYLEWGDNRKPGLVLVHGGAAHAHWWSFIAPQLTHHYHVVAIDLSGHGDSGRRQVYGSELWAEEIMRVAEYAGMTRPPIVVGHSMGGFVSLTSAMLYGDRLAGTILLDSPGCRSPRFQSPMETRTSLKVGNPTAAVMRLTWRFLPSVRVISIQQVDMLAR